MRALVFVLASVACGGIKPVGSVDRERPNIVSADARGAGSASLASSIELESGDLFGFIPDIEDAYPDWADRWAAPRR